MRNLLAFFITMVVAASGCAGSDGPGLGTVTGKVTLDGEPLAGMDITFQPDGGRPSMGLTDSNGNYQLQYSIQKRGALVGQHIVRISTAPPDDEDAGSTQLKEVLPDKYHRHTELTANVKPGRNRIDFPLKSE